jgi:hypothetical protein
VNFGTERVPVLVFIQELPSTSFIGTDTGTYSVVAFELMIILSLGCVIILENISALLGRGEPHTMRLSGDVVTTLTTGL